MTAQKEHANFFEVILYHVIHLVMLVAEWYWLLFCGWYWIMPVFLYTLSAHKEAYSHYSWYVHHFLGPCGSWQINENPEGLGWNKNYPCKCDVMYLNLSLLTYFQFCRICLMHWVLLDYCSLLYHNIYLWVLSLHNIRFSCTLGLLLLALYIYRWAYIQATEH